jgi:transposase
VRKFFCDEVYCERQVFCERLPTVVEPYSRRTIRLTEALNPVSMLVSAEVGRKITRPMGIRTSPDSLLRVARQCPEENEQSELTKVGIDDWAKRKGYTYGTIIIDLERGHPVALLPDRETATVKSWREQHPKLKLITRDRATAYAEACTEGAPQAEQIADLWHLLKNLREEGWEVLQQRQASELQDWLSRMRGCGVPEPQSLARGLERDYDAVRAALENQNTNGPTEGHVNRLKMLKRMMYGRANFDLLRAKVLYRG